eukprot:CAMPEP_0119369470 /NCGR_PEP_ID=MMETSP1334-20130426/15978_1 /TAXON_ID=127549 /ORGANISM="Calcidiscus leptoporus, Strain RCC1130" /LENGTH=207 /DNA_ID=CAMNT_0007386315 /DNA_START=188 /DNA_END=808 /DNA_ORIENTATION=+
MHKFRTWSLPFLFFAAPRLKATPELVRTLTARRCEQAEARQESVARPLTGRTRPGCRQPVTQSEQPDIQPERSTTRLTLHVVVAAGEAARLVELYPRREERAQQQQQLLVGRAKRVDRVARLEHAEHAPLRANHGERDERGAVQVSGAVEAAVGDGARQVDRVRRGQDDAHDAGVDLRQAMYLQLLALAADGARDAQQRVLVLVVHE